MPPGTAALMDDIAHRSLIERLTPTQRAAYDAFRRLGPATDGEAAELLGWTGASGRLAPRRLELARMGLVRPAGLRPGGPGRKGFRLWEATPADAVEAAREQARWRKPRRLDLSKHPLEQRVAMARRLLADDETFEALRGLTGPGARQARARAREIHTRAHRQRQAELREAEKERSAAVDFIAVRNHLQRNVELVKAVGAFLEGEFERRQRGEAGIPNVLWAMVPGLLRETIDACTEVYEWLARYTGSEPLEEADVELGEDEIIEDAEWLELAAALEDATQMAE